MRGFALAAAALLLWSLAGPARAAFAQPAQSADRSAGGVRTIAGSGRAGIADGAAASATFLLPSAIARGRDGTLYIADEAAQRIRALRRDGTVVTLAGSGEVAPDGLSVKGGYRDGDALAARFNRPDGIAVAPDGALYVSDRRNACIRKLDRGTVTTFAGKCTEAGQADGAAGSSRLQSPRALVFDAKGTLYVADYGTGIRAISPAGQVTTLHVKSTGDNRMWGIGIGGEPADPVLIASTPEAIVIVHLGTHEDSRIGTDTGAEGRQLFGSVNQLAGLSHREFLFTDVRSSDVRYLRLPASPFATTVFTRTVAGGSAERAVDNAGFRDGAADAARFFAPRGIVVHEGLAYVADAGNRRIREIVLPHFRVPESGLSDTTPYDTGHYHIMYVGASWAYWDSLGDDSICARLESQLDAAHRFSKPVRCHPVRIDAAGFQQLDDYLANYLQAHVDLVVLNLNNSEAYSLYPNSAPPSVAEAAATLKRHVAALQARLAKNGTKLLLLWSNDADDVSTTENAYEREHDPNGGNFPVDLEPNHVNTKLMIDALSTLPVYQLDLYDTLLAAERAPGPAVLYGTDDSHLSSRGAALLAQTLARFIIAQKAL